MLPIEPQRRREQHVQGKEVRHCLGIVTGLGLANPDHDSVQVVCSRIPRFANHSQIQVPVGDQSPLGPRLHEQWNQC
jgi:hypothetical protein